MDEEPDVLSRPIILCIEPEDENPSENVQIKPKTTL